jgi:hypothetical protein
MRYDLPKSNESVFLGKLELSLLPLSILVTLHKFTQVPLADLIARKARREAEVIGMSKQTLFEDTELFECRPIHDGVLCARTA